MAKKSNLKIKVGEKTLMSMPITVKGVDKENYTLTMVASSQHEDRHGDTVMQDGWDLRPYKTNPVILNSHNYNDATEVIAKATSTKIEGKGKAAKLVQVWKFAVDENPKAKIIFDLYAGGFLHASSVGFIPKKYKEGDYFTIEEAELLEVSAVAVPAHAKATIAKSIGVEVKDLEDAVAVEEEEEEVKEDAAEETETEEVEEEAETTEPVEEEEVEEKETEEEVEVEVKPEEQEPEAEPVVEEKHHDVAKKPLSKNSRMLKAIHSVEADKQARLKTAYATIKSLMEEQGETGMDDTTKAKARSKKLNKVIRSLIAAK